MSVESRIAVAVLIIALGLGIVSDPYIARAQNRAGDHIDIGANQMLNSPDKAFAIKAAQAGIAEVKLGRLAVQKASDPDVKAFGQRMVDDHTKANAELESVARQENMTLPTIPAAKQQAAFYRLNKLSGAAFDKAYMEDMLKDHETDVKEFQKEARAGKDPKIKNFAAQILPVLQDHLEETKSIRARMGGSSSLERQFGTTS